MVIKSFRALIGKTQEQMAHDLNITRQAYSAKENGKYAFSDSEKAIMRDMFRTIDKDLTIDDIFFK